MRNFLRRRQRARKIKRSKNDRQWVKDLKVPIKSSSPKDISEIKKERRRNSRKQNFSFLSKIFSRKFLFRFSILVLIFAVIGLAYVFAQENKLFFVRNINISGLQEIQKDAVRTNLIEFEGKSMYGFSVDDVRAKVIASNDLIDEAYVRKVLPDTLEIEVVERVPLIFISNFNETLLLDQNFNVIERIETPVVQLNEYELDVFNGFGDKDADYVKERYFLNLEGSEAEEFRAAIESSDGENEDPWDEIEEEEKEEVLKKIFDETNAVLGTWKESVKQKVAAQEFSDLRLIFFYKGLNFDENNDYYQKRARFANDFDIYFVEKTIEVRERVWITDFAYEVHVEDNKRFLLSIRRELQDQIRDIEALIWNNQYSNGSVFDLRTDIKITKR